MSKEFPDIAFVNVGGQAVPFTKPQHYKKGSTTDTLLTGEDNPLPTKDESVEARLQAIEQTQSQILNKLNDTIDTRLTGSIVEEVRIVNALALTDTSSSYHTINIGKYKKIRLYARSTVDSQIMLNIRPFPNTFNTTDFWDGENWVANDEIIIPARTQTFYLNSALPWLNDFIGTGDNFRVRVQALDTPTQGNLSVYLLGQVR